MEFFTRAKKTDARNFMVVDVGSSRVGAAIVQHTENERPQIIASAFKNFPLTNEPDFDHLVSMVSRSIDFVMDKLFKENVVAPEDIVVTLRAPWVASQTRLIHHHQKNPFIVTQDFADGLIQKEIERYNKKEIKEFAEYGDGHKLLEHKVMRVKLNGYPISDPIGKQCDSAEIASFMSVIQNDICDLVENRIAKYFHTDITTHSFIFGAYAMIKHMFRNQDDALIIDIGGEITELGVIRDDVLLQVASFPAGSQMITRYISEGLNISMKEAFSVIRMYNAGQLSDTRLHAVDPLIKKALKQWTGQLQTVLQDIASTSLVPNVLFVYADNETLPIFQKTLESEDFHQYVSSSRNFSVIPMTLDTLKGRVVDPKLEHDPFLITGMLFASLIVHRPKDDDWTYLL